MIDGRAMLVKMQFDAELAEIDAFLRGNAIVLRVYCSTHTHTYTHCGTAFFHRAMYYESEGERIWQACGKLGLFGSRVNPVNLSQIKRIKRKRGEKPGFLQVFLVVNKVLPACMAPSTRDAVELADELQGRLELCPL